MCTTQDQHAANVHKNHAFMLRQISRRSFPHNTTPPGPHTQEPDVLFSSRLECMTLPHVITQNPSHEKRCTHRWNAAKRNVSKQGGYILWKGERTYTHSKKNLIHRERDIYIHSFMQVASHPSSQRYLHTVVYVIEGSTHITRRQSNSGCSQACFCTSGNLEAAAACACSYSSAGRTLECRLQRAASLGFGLSIGLGLGRSFGLGLGMSFGLGLSFGLSFALALAFAPPSALPFALGRMPLV